MKKMLFLGFFALVASISWVAPCLAAVSLGAAAQFAALSTLQSLSVGAKATLSAGIGGGTSVSLGTSSLAGGDLVANPKGITLGKLGKVDGTCVTDGAKVKLGAFAACLNGIAGSSNPDLTTMSTAISDLGTFETTLAAQTPTQTFPALTVKKKTTFTITDTPGLNIVLIPSVNLQTSATLQLSGGATDTLILDVQGKLTLGSNARIVLMNGLTASQVIIVAGGKSVAIPKATQLDATLIVPNGSCKLGPSAVVQGAVLCGGKVSLATSAAITFTPYMV